MSASDRLGTRIMWSLVVGVVLGVLAHWAAGMSEELAGALKWIAVNVLDPIGQIFLRMLFFVVIPLVFSSLAVGVLQMGGLDRLGPMAAKTFALFALNMAIAVAIGLVMMNVLQPGKQIEPGTREKMLAEYSAGAKEIAGRAAAQPKVDAMFLVEMFMPRNLLKAVVEFQVLPLILFALMVGAAGLTLAADARSNLEKGLQIVTDIMTRIVRFALTIAPIAVPAMIMSVIIKFGLSFLQSLALFAAGCVAAMALHLFGTMSVMLKLLSKRSPVQFFKAIRTVIVTSFSTSSSNATLPTTIQVSREKLGISAPTAGFVLPLGATMNMSGTALYEGCVVLFIAQVYGVPLGLGQQIVLLFLSVLSAVAVAGVPGASLPLIVGLLINFGIPPEGIGLILGADRILDMARTTLNVGADVVTAVIIDDTMPREAQTG